MPASTGGSIWTSSLEWMDKARTRKGGFVLNLVASEIDVELVMLFKVIVSLL